MTRHVEWWRRTGATTVALLLLLTPLGGSLLLMRSGPTGHLAVARGTGGLTGRPHRPPSRATAPLVPWHGPVEELFFHPLVLRPELAFTNDRLGRGFEDYFVTAREFRLILHGLWHNGWTLVDAHRAATGRVRVPRGRKPFVLSEDDVNYYRYFAGRGLASRLVLDAHGEVRAEFRDRTCAHLSGDDLVPLVDAAVAEHPELSADGAKGVLAVTGFEGLLGEHHLSRPAARVRARALAARLRATGWTFASHTFGHIDLAHTAMGDIEHDTARWKDVADDVLGPVDLLVYPYGARPSPAGERLLRENGFPIQFDIDIRARRVVHDGVVVMSRRHVDGLAFGNPRRLAGFFDVDRVRDPARPPDAAG